MTPERWAAVERLCHQALLRQPGERADFLAQACAGDAALRREVESLLDHDGSGAFLSTPAAAQVGHLGSSGHLVIGRSVGSYVVSGRLGAGGMGEVYRARDQKLGRDVAIKILPPAFASDPDRLQRFAREARVLGSLNHPHIGAIYGLEETPTGQALVLELVDGPTLAERIARGAMPMAEVLAIARQVADALEAVHETGIVHRDLKPANIKVTAPGVVKVLDFGLAKIREGSASVDGELQSPTVTAGTRAGLVLGTAAYMSPEQARGQAVDQRTDIWAFGCVLYEMLTGRPTFAGATVSDTLAAVLEREPDWTALPENTPEPIHRVLRRCLDKGPNRRLRHIADALLDLDDVLNARPDSLAVRRRSRMPWLAAAATVACLALLTVWATARRPEAVPVEPLLRLQITPPSNGQFGTRSGFAISPDGRAIVYGANVGGKYALWLHLLDGAGATLLAGTENAASPFWSPDGRSVGFFANGKLWRIDTAGGAPFRVCDVPTVFGGAWMPDGRIIVGIFGGSLSSVPASGGVLTPLTTLDRATADVAHVWPQALPGGRFLYWSTTSKAADSGIYAASMDEPNRRVRLVSTDTRAFYAALPDGRGFLLWQRGGTLLAQAFDSAALKLVGEPTPVTDDVGTDAAGAYLAVSASANGRLVYAPRLSERLTWLDRSGAQLGTVGDPGRYDRRSIRFSPDGSQIAVTRTDTGRDLWLIDSQRGTARRTTHDSRGGYYSNWSPDGRTILFMGDNVSALYRRDATGTMPDERLAAWPASELSDWSRDGRFLLYTLAAQDTSSDIWVAPVTADGHLVPNSGPRPYLRTPVFEAAARFAPGANPRWVAYESNESGRLEAYVRSFPDAGSPRRISVAGGRDPQWSADGREILFLSAAGKIEAVSVKLGEDSVETSAPRELFPLPPGANEFSLAPDGRRFLVRVPESADRPLTVIVNWPALLGH